MFDFRKALLLLAVLVFATGIVSAQGVTCSTTSTPSLMRAEGLTEPIGTISVECRNLVPGQPVGPLTFRLFTNPWQITSKVVGTGPLLESTLLIGEPGSATVIGTNAYLATVVPGNADLTTGVVTAIEWTNVAFTPTTTTQRFHIVNVRVNATAAGQSTSPIPVGAILGVTGTGLPVTSSSVTVGYVQKGFNFSNIGNTSFSQCLAGSTRTVSVAFGELLPDAFRPAQSLGNQDSVNVTYGTESMYYPVGTTTAGIATQGTQIAVTVNAPTGVAVQSSSVPTTITGSNGTVLTLVSANTANPLIYEVTSANTGAYDTFTLNLTLTISGIPPVGTGTVTVGLAPTGGNTPVATPVPRFTTAASGSGSIAITSCVTRLLFPFVTSDAGFDTGIAISNTSRDPFGTTLQDGACQLWFYGNKTVPKMTTTTVNAGEQLIWSLSTGDTGKGVQPAPGFTGYLIAECNFQYAHGYAFISDLGASKLAQGYLALVLGQVPMPTNTGRYTSSPMEALNQ